MKKYAAVIKTTNIVEIKSKILTDIEKYKIIFMLLSDSSSFLVYSVPFSSCDGQNRATGPSVLCSPVQKLMLMNTIGIVEMNSDGEEQIDRYMILIINDE